MAIEFTFKSVYKPEWDNWNSNGEIITDSDKLSLVAKALKEGKALLAEHWHYRGSRPTDRILIANYDSFINYLKENAIAGDTVNVFDITAVLKEGNLLVTGKCPDAAGEVPERGAY
jgi:hypothetical protein